EGRLLGDGAGEICVLQAGGKEHGVHLRINDVVGLGDLHFTFEISYRPESPDDNGGAVVPGKVHSQPGEALDLHIGQVPDTLPNQLYPFLNGEEGVLGPVNKYPDDQLVHHFGGPLDDIQVAPGDGIKTAG